MKLYKRMSQDTPAKDINEAPTPDAEEVEPHTLTPDPNIPYTPSQPLHNANVPQPVLTQHQDIAPQPFDPPPPPPSTP